MPEYDPKTCVHASELRERGFKIPSNIPDCAWVPRGSWTIIGPVNVEVDERDKTLFHFDMGELVFTHPFRWIEGKFVIQKQCSHCGSTEKPVSIIEGDTFTAHEKGPGK